MTHVGPFASRVVSKHVNSKMTALSELHVAHVARVRLFARVCLVVYLESATLGEMFVAYIALVRFFASVR